MALAHKKEYFRCEQSKYAYIMSSCYKYYVTNKIIMQAFKKCGINTSLK